MSREHDNSVKKSRHRRGEKKMQAVAMANGYDARSVSFNYEQQPPRGWHARVAQKLERWGFLYNVTTGLYMLDWWERCLFNAVFLVFLLVACYNSGHYLSKFLAWCGDDSASQWFESVVGGQHLRTAFGALGGRAWG